MRKLPVSSRLLAVPGVFCLLGVGDGDRDVCDLFLDVPGVVSKLPRGVRVISPRFVGLFWPSLANVVMSGTSEKVLKHVSSILI